MRVDGKKQNFYEYAGAVFVVVYGGWIINAYV